MGFVSSSHKIRPLNHHDYHHQIPTNCYNNYSSLVQASSLLISSNYPNNTTFSCYETNIPSTTPSSTSFLSAGASTSCTSGITASTFAGRTTSSDESYDISNFNFHSYMYNNSGVISEGEKLISGNNASGCYVDEQQNPLDYSSLEEIKDLISTNHGTCNSTSFLLDHEIKTEEKVIMYY